jgi:hypothetical protein
MILIFFITSCKNVNEDMLQGKWIIKSVEISNFNMSNKCLNINSGDQFIFEDNKLDVIKNNLKCFQYKYVLREGKLTIMYSDTGFEMKVVNVSDNKMNLRCKRLPKEMMINWKEDYLKYKKEGFLITLERK